MTTNGKLTRKQAAFVAEYLCDLNAARAAIRAGYSKRTARQIGDENLSKPAIAAAIEKAMAERSARIELTQDRVLQELVRIAFFDIRKAFNADGSMKPLNELDDDTASAIAGIEVFEERDKEGVVIGRLKKLKISDKLSALDKLARHLGLLVEKLKVGGDSENPLELILKRIQGSSIKPIVELPLVAISHGQLATPAPQFYG